MHRRLSPAIGFVYVTLLIDMIGFGIIIPVMPGQRFSVRALLRFRLRRAERHWIPAFAGKTESSS